MTQFISTLVGIFQSSGFARFGEPGGYLYAIMICVGCFLLYLAIVKEFEPLILLPMAFGMILANLPGSGIIHMQYFVGDGLEHPMWVEILNNGGLADMLYMGVKLGIYPPLIFLGIGTMTDFAPLISNPKSLLLGAAAQFGIFGTYMGARLLAATGLVDFTQKQSAAISIIGGADGPTAIFVTSRLAPELLGSIAVAAYSYMALVPVIQPPIMKAMTTSKERSVVMKQLRTVSKTERIIFPIMVTIIVSLIVPDAAVLVGMLMLGNLMKECGVVDRIQKTAGNELMNIITIFLALSVGCTTSANTFLNTRTLFIIVLGLIAFASIIFGNLMALSQTNIKRLLGYSSISHLGYLLVALIALQSGEMSMEAVGVYLAGYLFSSLGAFGVVSLMSSPYRGPDADSLFSYRGLFWHRPILSAVMTVMMLSLAGIPMTLGFIGKFYVLAVGVHAHLWWLVAAVVVGSAIGLYYYLRVAVSLYLSAPEQLNRDAPSNWQYSAGGIVVLISALLVLVLGIWPQPLISIVQLATPLM